MAMNYEQHVQQNNERLLCIKQALQESTTFVSAAKELLEWCLDPRAFQKPFEDNIIACLSTVSHVAKRDGYDLNLGCRLLSICANYRDKFSPNYAVLLEQWNEELSKAVLLRHQPGTSATMDPNKMMQKQSSMMGNAQQDMMWSNAPGGAVSVVTTVYSGVSGFNSVSQQSYSAANTGMYNNGISAGSSGYLHNIPSAASMQKSSMYSNVDNSYNSYNQDYHQGPNGDYNPNAPHAALNAAQVAAAAVATATATATAVALDQSQYQPYHGPTQSSAYNSQQYPSSVGVVHNQYATNPRMLPPNGIGRPHMPPTYMPPGARARASAVGARYPMSGQKLMAPTAVPTQHYPEGPMMQQHMGRGLPSSYPPQSGMHRPGPVTNPYQKFPNAVRSHYPMQPSSGVIQPNTPYANDGYQNGMTQNQMSGHISCYQPRLYANSAQFNGMTGVCPGNPSQPVTPNNGSMVSPPRYSSVPQMTGVGSMNVKPAMNCQDAEDDDSRLTIPVPNGVIMKPFRLEHNSPVSQHPFFLSEPTYNVLCYSVDHDLQLKCFHQEDKSTACHWPANANVQICINGTPVLLQNPNKPLYIKSHCQPNQNTLQISVQQCSCSHLFVLTMVERPRILTVKDMLLQKRLLTTEQAMDKIKRHFQNNDVITIDGQKSDMEQIPINVPLRCPLSMRRMEFPARGQHCQHIRCFDLETFLSLNRDRSSWPCPICKDELHKDTLEIDQFIWGIINNLHDQSVEEVTIDSKAVWKAVRHIINQDSNDLVKIKDEVNGLCNGTKRFKPDPGLNGYQWTPPPSTYGTASTPVNFAASPMSSPSYCQTNSPLPPNSQRQRNLTSATVSTYGLNGRSSRQSVDSVLNPSKVSSVTNNFPQHSSTVGHPRSVGNPASVDAMPLNFPHSSLTGAQSTDGGFAGSAPYTPASVSSSGSLNNGPSSIMTNSDSYGNDLYSDLDFLLNDSTTTNSMSLLGDCMDELDMLKYLDNTDGDIGAVSATNPQSVDRTPPLSKPPNVISTPIQTNNSRRSNNISSSTTMNGHNFVSSNELSAMGDVLSNYLS